jgi:hypothetical protein
MIEALLAETRLSLTLLAREQSVSVPTAWRWTLRGIKGYVLESFSLGGRKYTTREAFARWVAATNGEKVAGGQTPQQRKASVDRAEKELAEMGI